MSFLAGCFGIDLNRKSVKLDWDGIIFGKVGAVLKPVYQFPGYMFQWSRNMPDMPDMSGRLLLMSGRELRPCRTFCPAGFTKHKMCDKENKNVDWYLPEINWQKCLTGAQNVRQTTEGLPILSGTPEIIFAITACFCTCQPSPGSPSRPIFNSNQYVMGST